ncbi:SpoIIE family protein phosphatase [bacterium]|nr:SpoIIE family protein phosphatase [bacterium]
MISKTKSKVFTLQTRFQNEIQTFYITGMKGNNLKKFLLFSFTPDTTIREEIYFDSLRLGLFFLVIMCISFAVGSLLLNQFLEPVRNLSLGMKALEQRCFDHKIPIINRDELGRLSDTFNQIMEGLADLEVARVVQDAFFPREILSANGWEVYGTCTPASRVGGDYFDYFLVDENKIAVIVGDVSGHGVSAALVVAMAKALIAHPANEFNPSKIFNMIDKIFSETLKRRKMMTCFFGIIDIIEGKFLASNAGHNYPFILSGEKAEHISFPGFPLGVNSRRKYQVSEINLNENDCMIFYTDGFIEAFDRNGVSIGYPKVKNALPALLKNSAFETENALREWHRSIARPGPLDDDITLVVVQKRLTHPL